MRIRTLSVIVAMGIFVPSLVWGVDLQALELQKRTLIQATIELLVRRVGELQVKLVEALHRERELGRAFGPQMVTSSPVVYVTPPLVTPIVLDPPKSETPPLALPEVVCRGEHNYAPGEIIVGSHDQTENLNCELVGGYEGSIEIRSIRLRITTSPHSVSNSYYAVVRYASGASAGSDYMFYSKERDGKHRLDEYFDIPVSLFLDAQNPRATLQIRGVGDSYGPSPISTILRVVSWTFTAAGEEYQGKPSEGKDVSEC